MRADHETGKSTKIWGVGALLAGLVAGLAFIGAGCSGVTASSTTTPPPTPSSLTISNTSTSTVTSTAATITWQTNLAANSQIAYGPSTSYGSTTSLDSAMVTSHSEGLSGLKAGTAYHFQVMSKDSNGNQATSPDQTFTTASGSDTTPPTVSITAPANNAAVSGTITVTANASDNVGVVGVQFKVDGTNIGAEDTTSPYSASLNTTTLSNATHVLTATARDAAGNVTTSSGVSVTVNNADTTPPTVSITAPANNASVSGTVTITASASDNVGVASVQFQVDSANTGSLDTTSPYSISWDSTSVANGNHTIRAIAKDAAGNSTTSSAITVAVSNTSTPPSVPAGLTATAISASQINLSWTASTGSITGYKVFRGGSQVGTSTTTSYSDTGLSASTSYSYTVAAYNGAGTSGQSAAAVATTFAPPTGGGIPSALGWFQIPNTQIQSVCPPNNFNNSGYPFSDACHGVVDAWSGGTGDTTRNRLLVWGGGHTNYSGNEVYALDLNSLQMMRLTDPTLPVASSCVESLSGGTPNSRHTYDGVAYIASADKMFGYSGSLACSNGDASQGAWTLNLSNLQWTLQTNNNPNIPNGGHASAEYDPNSQNVYLHMESYGNFSSFNLATNTLKVLNGSQAVIGAGTYYVTSVVDPKRKLYFMFGGGNVYKIDISGNDASYNMATLNGTNCGFISAPAPGAAYDTVQDRIVGWSGGNTVYMYNPDTDSCTSVSYANGPGAQQTQGTYGRFRYFPALGVFALVNDVAQNAYTLRLTPASGGTPPGGGPAISSVGATAISSTGATIGWTTDVGATTQLEYGTTTSYGTLTTLNSSLVTSHSVTISGLTAATTYHYRVHSKNSGGTESISGDFSFQTNTAVDNTPPTVNLTAPASGATLSATVSVSANASDNASVSSVQFLLDGANLGAPVTTAPYTISWDTTTAANGSHVLGATAIDPSGNVGNATGVTVTVSNSGTPDPALADFQARCAATGVIVCEGWDDPSRFTLATGAGGYATGMHPADDGTSHGTMDTTNKVSGAGALKFTINAGSVTPLTTNPTGFWFAGFGPDGNVKSFAQNSTLYFQFRLRLDPNMLNYDWTQVSGQGWKVFIAYGPIPGPSCTGAQFVQENSYQTNVFTAYTSCGTPGLETNNGVPPMLIEQGDYNCPYSSSGGYASNPNCFAYPSNTWITEYWVVQIGTWGQPNSHFTAYVGLPGQALKRVIDLPNFTFNAGGASNDALNALILQPYFSGATGARTNPQATMWFDELIISSQPIAAPKF